MRLNRHKASVFPWESIRVLPGGADSQKGTSPTPSSYRGEAGDTGYAVHDLRDDVASLEEGLSQMGALSKMLFIFLQSSQSPSEWSLLPEHQQDHPTHKDLMQPTLTFPNMEWLINNRYVPGWSWRVDYQSCSPCPREAILFFGRWSLKEELQLRNARDVGFSLTGHINWASRTAHIEVTINTVKGGHQAIVEAVVKKRTKARGPGCPCRTTKVTRTDTMAYDIEEWMWGMEEDFPKVEARNDNENDCRPEWRNTYSQCAGQGSRQHRRQGRPWFLRGMSGGSPSSWGESSDQGSHWNSQQSTMMRASGESTWPVQPGRGLRVMVNLLIFKDEKTKNAVSYCSWWWDIAIFCCSGWDEQHLLPYVFWSLQGFPGDLAMSLGEDATLSDVLQKLDKHDGVVLMFSALSKEFYSLKQRAGENIATFGACLSQQVKILQMEYLGKIQQEHLEEMKCNCFYWGLNPK